jgi:CRP/FNR family cyclic AMP-dependent transcriptional regulator
LPGSGEPLESRSEHSIERSVDVRNAVEGGHVGSSDITTQLGEVPLFSGCSRRELGVIARAAKHVSHKENTVLAREGDRGIGLFLITDGTAKVTIGGKQKPTLKAGDFFGEIALLDGGARTATVTSTSPVELLGLTEWVFRGLLMEHPSIALKTLESLAGRLREASKNADV